MHAGCFREAARTGVGGSGGRTNDASSSSSCTTRLPYLKRAESVKLPRHNHYLGDTHSAYLGTPHTFRAALCALLTQPPLAPVSAMVLWSVRMPAGIQCSQRLQLDGKGESAGFNDANSGTRRDTGMQRPGTITTRSKSRPLTASSIAANKASHGPTHQNMTPLRPVKRDLEGLKADSIVRLREDLSGCATYLASVSRAATPVSWMHTPR